MSLQTRFDLQVAKTEAGRQIDELPTRMHENAQLAKRQSKRAHGMAP